LRTLNLGTHVIEGKERVATRIILPRPTHTFTWKALVPADRM
jgi:hypothetical protein